ncbi:HesB/IscA family protein [Streptomyces sp. NPDC020681]|uniref:HesB/IscA family protein n=1 Tax=Streptomyces sp. NPDC020681 TaxID=3365083 RepID=UPI00378D52D2
MTEQSTITPPPRYSVNLSDAAVEKIRKLLEPEEPGLALRISVQPGGCSGMRYQLYFTDEYAKVLRKQQDEDADEGFAEPDDATEANQRTAMETAGESVQWYGGFAVVVDKLSGPFLDGAEIDYADTLQKQGFTIDNPNAQGTCGCGDSFQ